MGGNHPDVLLAYVIAVVGLVIIVVGAWGLFLFARCIDAPDPLEVLAIAIGLISGGLGMVGVAQALRLLALIYRSLQKSDYDAMK